MTPRIRLTSGTTVLLARRRSCLRHAWRYWSVWADENTREGIFDALKRKGVLWYIGTTHSSPISLAAGIIRTDLDKDSGLYQKGLCLTEFPWAAIWLPNQTSAKAPTFAVSALKDPQSGNLDRSSDHQRLVRHQRLSASEKIYDVAMVRMTASTDPKTGKASAPVGNTVDVKKATYTNDIGDDTVEQHVWTDPGL